MFAYEQAQQLWWDDALCNDSTGALADLFFSEQLDDIATAKAFCRPCPVREACLAGALARREPWGVWGGELLSQRQDPGQQAQARSPPQGPPGGNRGPGGDDRLTRPPPPSPPRNWRLRLDGSHPPELWNAGLAKGGWRPGGAGMLGPWRNGTSRRW